MYGVANPSGDDLENRGHRAIDARSKEVERHTTAFVGQSSLLL
jgi:hypothetical protein